MTISNTQNRHRGTQSDGRTFSQEHIEAAWGKAHQAMDNHPLIHKACKTFSKAFKEGTHVLDDYGHVIAKNYYGKKEKHGLEIDHVHPVERKETYMNGPHAIDEIENIRVLYWESNKRKGNNDVRIYELEYEHIILNKSA